MPLFREKSIVIEALKLGWVNWGEMCDFASVGKLSDGKPEGCYLNEAGFPRGGHENSDRMGLLIPTLEGLMIGPEGDWIIKDIKGALYPCKPDIFETTYEAVAE